MQAFFRFSRAPFALPCPPRTGNTSVCPVRDELRYDEICSAIIKNGAERFCTALIGNEGVFPGITLSLRRRWRKPIRLPSSRPPCGGSRVCVSLSGKLFEIALGDAGNRACPVIGTLFERRSGGWKSCRRRIPIIYRRNHPSPLLQSGSGAVFVAERAVSVTPYRKTISPQTTQLLFLSLSLSKIGIIDGFLSDKSIREIGKFIKYNIISDFHSDFHRGGDFVMGEF